MGDCRLECPAWGEQAWEPLLVMGVAVLFPSRTTKGRLAAACLCLMSGTEKTEAYRSRNKWRFEVLRRFVELSCCIPLGGIKTTGKEAVWKQWRAEAIGF